MWLWIATALATLTALLHIFVGTGEVRGPLIAASIDPLAEQQLLLAWHLLSLVLLALAAMLFDAAARGNRTRGREATWLTAALAAGSLIMALTSRLGAFGLPQWLLFAATTATATVGLRR